RFIHKGSGFAISNKSVIFDSCRHGSSLLLMVTAHQASIHHECRPGYVGCVVRCQKSDDAGHVVRRAKAAQGNLRQQIVELGLIGEQGLIDRGYYRARCNIVDGDSKWPEFDGKTMHEHAQTALAAA